MIYQEREKNEEKNMNLNEQLLFAGNPFQVKHSPGSPITHDNSNVT